MPQPFAAAVCHKISTNLHIHKFRNQTETLSENSDQIRISFYAFLHEQPTEIFLWLVTVLRESPGLERVSAWPADTDHYRAVCCLIILNLNMDHGGERQITACLSNHHINSQPWHKLFLSLPTNSLKTVFQNIFQIVIWHHLSAGNISNMRQRHWMST